MKKIFTLLSILMLLSACDYNHAYDKCKLLYKGQYDIVYSEEDSLYFIIPTINKNDNDKVQVFKKNGEEIQIENVEQLNEI